MNTENGWSKIRNDIHDDPLLNKDSEYLSVWIYLITHQAYGEYKAIFSGKVITLKEGQLLTSLGEISKKTGVTTSKINRILKMLKSEKRIKTQTDMQKTLVTLDTLGCCETESEKGNEKRMKNEWKTIQETENEKEKRSKREKDKEKEINKTIKTDKNIYPLISPTGEKRWDDFSLPSGKSLFSSDKENVYIPKTEEELDRWLNQDDGIDEWDKMQLYYRQLHSDQRSVVSDQQLDYDIDTKNASSFALANPIQPKKKEININSPLYPPSCEANHTEGVHIIKAEPCISSSQGDVYHQPPRLYNCEANPCPQIGHAPVPRIFGEANHGDTPPSPVTCEANHTEGVHIIKAEPCISSSQRDVYHQPQGCIEFNPGEHLPQATSFEATPQLHCEALHLNKVQHRSEKDLEEFFGLFWQAYPKKVGKGYAQECFKKIRVSRKLLDTMLEAIAKQKKSDMWKRDKGQYIPNPSTWLNQKRWEDDLGGETEENPWSSFKLGIEL